MNENGIIEPNNVEFFHGICDYNGNPPKDDNAVRYYYFYCPKCKVKTVASIEDVVQMRAHKRKYLTCQMCNNYGVSLEKIIY